MTAYNAIAVDITFRNKNGDEIEPDGAISVSMSTSRSVNGESHQVLHIDDSGNASQVAGASADGASFEAGEFSIYVITGSDENQKPAIATYIFHGADGKVISTQKVKDGETVYAPTTPEKDDAVFLGWSSEAGKTTKEDVTQEPFSSMAAEVTGTAEINLYPVFAQQLYVFFMDKNCRVWNTRQGISGDKISTLDIRLSLSSTESVTGWYYDEALT